MFPVPTCDWMRTKVDRRVQKTEAQLWWFRRLAPGADSVYPMRALSPHECVAIHSYTLSSQEFVSICHIPTYQSFLETVDLRPAYRWQERFLQHLQLRSPIRRWVLQSPDHVFGLEELLAVFPDAIIIQTHRDPFDVLKSQIQLTQVLEGLFCRPDKLGQLQVREARKVAQMLDYMSRFRDAHPELSEQFIDVKYSELITDPLAVVRHIYEHLGIRLANPTAERMQHIASSRSRYRRRHASPALADLNFSGTDETRAFDSYRDRFGIHCPENKERLTQSRLRQSHAGQGSKVAKTGESS